MIKETKHTLIDPSDESLVIVSSGDSTRIWLEGKEVENAISITFSHKEDGEVAVDVKIAP